MPLFGHFLATAFLLAWQPLTADAAHLDDLFEPVQQRLGMLQTAAQASLQVYTNEKPPEASEFYIATNRRGTSQQSALMITQDDEYCYFAFRGGSATQSLTWVKEINLQSSFTKTIQNPKKRCRVVRQYNKLQGQKTHRTKGRYHAALLDAVQHCVQEDKKIVLTGHDIGGAVATVWGVALHGYKPPQRRRRLHDGHDIGQEQHVDKVHPWIVTFGSPPVFSPLLRKDQSLIDGSIVPGELPVNVGKKRPCKYISYDKMVQFVNTEFDLYFDFMWQLNTLMYGVIQNATSSYHVRELHDNADQLSCLIKGADHVRDFYAGGKRGNLGSPFGQIIFLGPSDETADVRDPYFRDPTTQIYFQVIEEGFKQSFDNSNFIKTEAKWLLLPQSCRNDDGDIHNMESYLFKINLLSDKWIAFGYHPFYPCTPGFKCSASSGAMEMRRRL